MAVITCCSFPLHNIPVKKTSPLTKKHSNRIMMLKHGSARKTPTLQIRSSAQNKVFEDRSEGVICYVDESGEIVCEGYDEGPRFHLQIPRTTYHPRDAEILDLLQQRWLEIVNGGQPDDANRSSIAVQEDFKWKNGFNKL